MGRVGLVTLLRAYQLTGFVIGRPSAPSTCEGSCDSRTVSQLVEVDSGVRGADTCGNPPEPPRWPGMRGPLQGGPLRFSVGCVKPRDRARDLRCPCTAPSRHPRTCGRNGPISCDCSRWASAAQEWAAMTSGLLADRLGGPWPAPCPDQPDSPRGSRKSRNATNRARAPATKSSNRPTSSCQPASP